MVTVRKFNILLIMVVFSFGLITSWSVPATAYAVTAKQTKVKAVRLHAAKNVKQAPRIQKPATTQVQTPNVGGVGATTCYYPCNPCGNTPTYTWNVPAAAGGSYGQAGSQPAQPQAPPSTTGSVSATAPQAQPSVSPGQVCYNTWVPCSTAPGYSWNVPATSGGGAGSTYGGPVQPQQAPTQGVAPQAGTTTYPQGLPAGAATSQVPACYNGWVQCSNGPMYWSSCSAAPVCY